MRKSSEWLQSVTLADPQFSRRPLGNNAPSKGPPLIFFVSVLLVAMVCLPVCARQLRRVAGAVQRGKRENGTRSRRRSVSVSEKRAEGEGERARKNRFTRLPATGVWWASGQTSANPGQLGCETAGATTLNGSSMGHGAGRRAEKEGKQPHFTQTPPLSSGPSSTPHSQLLHPPPSSSQQEAVDVGVFSWPPLTLFCGRRSLSNLTIGTGTSKRNHHVRQPAPGEPPRRCCLPDSEYGFDGALSLRLFFVLGFQVLSPDFQRPRPSCCCSAPLPPSSFRLGAIVTSQRRQRRDEARRVVAVAETRTWRIDMGCPQLSCTLHSLRRGRSL